MGGWVAGRVRGEADLRRHSQCMCVVYYEVVNFKFLKLQGGAKIELSESMFGNPSRSFLCVPHRVFYPNYLGAVYRAIDAAKLISEYFLRICMWSGKINFCI